MPPPPDSSAPTALPGPSPRLIRWCCFQSDWKPDSWPRRTGTGTDLLVRVYPDDIHIDSHEPGVTPEEERWGTQFWAQIAAVPSGPEQAERKRAAWQQLTERFGTTRAAWLAQALDPARSTAVTRRDDTWTRAPYTQTLPDRWVVIGYRGDNPAHHGLGQADS